MPNSPEEEAGEWLIALTPLNITNAPGAVPSTLKVPLGQRFQLDGDEQVDVAHLFHVRAIAVYTGSPEQEKLRASRGNQTIDPFLFLKQALTKIWHQRIHSRTAKGRHLPQYIKKHPVHQVPIELIRPEDSVKDIPSKSRV